MARKICVRAEWDLASFEPFMRRMPMRFSEEIRTDSLYYTSILYLYTISIICTFYKYRAKYWLMRHTKIQPEGSEAEYWSILLLDSESHKYLTIREHLVLLLTAKWTLNCICINKNNGLASNYIWRQREKKMRGGLFRGKSKWSLPPKKNCISLKRGESICSAAFMSI